MKRVLDACCGSRMFWFDKENPEAEFVDIRDFECELCDGRKLVVHPSLIADFTNLPFADESFPLVVFDPPHLIRAGKNSWIAKKYGVLPKGKWRETLTAGFSECFRVLRPDGALIFKWNEEQIKTGEVLKLSSIEPLFGDRRGKTRWVVFMK